MPSYKIIILEQAVSEIAESCLYYNKKLPALGFEFEEEVFQKPRNNQDNHFVLYFHQSSKI